MEYRIEDFFDARIVDTMEALTKLKPKHKGRFKRDVDRDCGFESLRRSRGCLQERWLPETAAIRSMI